MDWANVKSLTIPEGDVKAVAIRGVTVWQKPNPLPYDAEVEYVESTGTQYIDTGVAPGDNEIGFSLVAKNLSTGGYAAFFGCRDDISGGVYVPSNYSAFIRSNSGGEMRADIANTGSAVSTPLRSSTEYQISWDRTTAVLTVRNVNSGTTTTLAAASRARNDYSFALLGINTAGTFAAGAQARLYSATFSRAGALVRDFAPVRVGTAGALYDRANGALYLSATSTPLVAGPDKTGA